MAVYPKFRSDTFSRPHPKFSQVSPKTSNQLRRIVRNHYANLALQIKDVVQIKAHELNSRNFKLRCEKGSYLLKSLSESDKGLQRRLERQVRLIEKARRQKVWIPLIYRSDAKKCFVKADRRIWILMEFVKGAYVAGSEKDLIRFCAAAGKLSAFLKRQNNVFPGAQKRTYFTAEEREVYSTLCKKKSDVAVLNPFERRLERCREAILAHYEALEPVWSRLCHKKLSLCHIDLHPHNVIIGQDGRVYFLDLDSVIRGVPAASLGFGIFKVVRNFMACRPAKVSRQKAKALVAKMRRCVMASKGLSRKEMCDLKWGAEVEILKRVLYIVWDYQKHKSLAWAHLLENHMRAFEEVDFLLS